MRADVSARLLHTYRLAVCASLLHSKESDATAAASRSINVWCSPLVYVDVPVTTLLLWQTGKKQSGCDANDF